MQREGRESSDDEKCKQAHLGHGKKIAELISSSDSAIVYGGKKSDEDGKGGCPRKRLRHCGNEFAQVGDEEVRYCRNSGNARQPS
jgi:hypothetical protein